MKNLIRSGLTQNILYCLVQFKIQF